MMNDNVIVVVKFLVPRKDAYSFVESLSETVEDFVLDEHDDVKQYGEIETEEIPERKE